MKRLNLKHTKMKKALLKVTVMLLCLAGVTPVMAQFNLKKAVGEP